MRKNIIILFMGLFPLLALAQGSFEEIKLPSYPLFSSDSYSIDASVVGNNTVKYTVKYTGDTTIVETFVLFPNDWTTFTDKFSKIYLDKVIRDEDKGGEEFTKTKVREEASKTYFQYVAAYALAQDMERMPVAGELCLHGTNLPVNKISYTERYIIKEVKKRIRKLTDSKDSIYIIKHKRNRYRVDTTSQWLFKKHFKSAYARYLIDSLNRKYLIDIYSLSKPYNDSLEKLTALQKEMKEWNNKLRRAQSEAQELSNELKDYRDQIDTYEMSVDTFMNMNDSYWRYSYYENLKASSMDFDQVLDDLISDYQLDITSERMAQENLTNELQELISRLSSMKQSEGFNDNDLLYLSLVDDSAQVSNRLAQTENRLPLYESAIQFLFNTKLSVRPLISKVNAISPEYDSLIKVAEHFKKDTIPPLTIKIKRSQSHIDSVQSILKNKYEDLVRVNFSVIYSEIDFNEGFIENITVLGRTSLPSSVGKETDHGIRIKTDTLKFENLYPIGFTSKNDFEYLKSLKLYAKKNEQDTYVLNMSDLFKGYYQRHKNNRRDYSPGDQVVRFNSTTGFCQELRKEETYKLLEAKIFSDFAGFGYDAPNGLIQTEISREFRLYTKRRRFVVSNTDKDSWNFAWFSYVEPKIVISKIENNNKSAMIRTVTDSSETTNYLSTIDLRRHETLSINPGELNLFFIDAPGLKSTFYFNAGTRFGRTSVMQTMNEAVNDTNMVTTDTTYGINTFSAYPRFILEIRTDERIGLHFSYSAEFFKSLTTDFVQVNNYEDYSDGRATRLLHSLEFNGMVNPNDSKTGRFFVRYRYSWVQGSSMLDGYHQAQVGYSFNIFGKTKEKEGEGE